MTAPQFAMVPQAMIDVTRQWLAALALRSETQSEARSPNGGHLTADQPSVVAIVPARPGIPTVKDYRAAGVYISAGTTLFGIVTEPRSDEKRRRAVIS